MTERDTSNASGEANDDSRGPGEARVDEHNDSGCDAEHASEPHGVVHHVEEDPGLYRTLQTPDADMTHLGDVSDVGRDRFALLAATATTLAYEWKPAKDTLAWFGDSEAALGYCLDRMPSSRSGWYSMVHPSDLQRLQQRDSHVAPSPGSVSEEYRVQHQDGMWRTWRDVRSPLLDGKGRCRAWIGACHDITDQRRLQRGVREHQKMEALGSLATGVAHDFNNILQGILICTQIVSESLPVDSHSAELMRDALDSVDRAGELIQRILNFSRQTEGEKTSLQLHRVVEETLKLLRKTAPSSIEIRHDMICEGDVVYADPVQMHQVVMNLCTNGCQAMRDHGGVLEVRVTAMSSDRLPLAVRDTITTTRAVCLHVADEGCGMDEATAARVFDPYFTTKADRGGTGLGLAVVKGIAEEHRGAVHVQSALGMGSQFSLFLPAAVAEEQVETTAKPSRPQETYQGEILFVDDEQTIVRLTALGLTRMGFTVHTEQDPCSALASFRSDPHRYDVVVTDMTMPGMLGTELVREIRSIRPAMPAILCTGYSDLIDDEKADTLGIDTLVMKPINYRELARHIARIMP